MSGRTKSEERKAKSDSDVVKKLTRGRPQKSPSRKSPSRKSPTRAEPLAKSQKKSPPKRSGSKSPSRQLRSARVGPPADEKSPTRNSDKIIKKTENKEKSEDGPLGAAPSARRSLTRNYDITIKKTENKEKSEEGPTWGARGTAPPARRSLTRSAKITTSTPIIDVGSDSETETKIPRPQFQIRGRTRKIGDVTPVRENSDVLKPRTRLSASRELEKIVPREDFVSISQETKKLTEFSDEDEVIIAKKVELEPPKIHLKLMFRSEYGGLYGALLLLILIPIMTIAVQYFSEKKSNYSLDYFKKPSTYYDFYSYVGVSSFFLVNFLLAKFPFGSKPEGQLKAFSTSAFTANGWFSLILTYATWFGLEYYGVPISDYIFNHFAQITIAGLLFGFILSTFLYIQSSYVPVGSLNPMGNTNNEVYDFLVGRQVAPCVFGVHMKVFLLRSVAIAKGIFTIILLAKSLNITKPISQYIDVNDLKTLNIDPTMIAICTMIYITVIDRIYFEKTLASTFELRHEGQGYLCNMQYIASAFLYPTIAKYVFDHNVQLDRWCLATVCSIFFVAAILNRACNNQKYVFRVNPYSPKVANFDTIPTSQGRKLLAGGLWGLVRHPNYLTEVIMNLCLAAFVWKSPIVVYILYVILMLLYRAKRVEYRVKQKYESAWDRYCQQVRYMILPKVY